MDFIAPGCDLKQLKGQQVEFGDLEHSWIKAVKTAFYSRIVP